MLIIINDDTLVIIDDDTLIMKRSDTLSMKRNDIDDSVSLNPINEDIDSVTLIMMNGDMAKVSHCS